MDWFFVALIAIAAVLYLWHVHNVREARRRRLDLPPIPPIRWAPHLHESHILHPIERMEEGKRRTYERLGIRETDG